MEGPKAVARVRMMTRLPRKDLGGKEVRRAQVRAQSMCSEIESWGLWGAQGGEHRMTAEGDREPCLQNRVGVCSNCSGNPVKDFKKGRAIACFIL